MNGENENNVLNTTILNKGIAKPKSISKEDALKEVRLSKDVEENTNKVIKGNIAIPQSITKEELDEQRVNEINDLMKNDYVKLVEVKHSKKTYIILFIVLALILSVIIYEIIYYMG